jgi:hypothetical protein
MSFSEVIDIMNGLEISRPEKFPPYNDKSELTRGKKFSPPFLIFYAQSSFATPEPLKRHL